jgi:16S rRNA (cytosine1402-N4)-methyltransferase
MNNKMDHNPVMLQEVIENLSPKSGELYLDCTFGAGGYTKAILETGANVVAIDRDPSAKKYADILHTQFSNQLKFVNSTFANTANYHNKNELFDGIVLDLGVSSMQLDQAERGFSFMHEGSLDMRMGQDGKSAKDLVNNAPEEELARIIYEYGDEIASRRIAKSIVTARETHPLETTTELAEIVRKAIGHRAGKIDPATKTFQAIRIWVNDEMDEIESFLRQAASMLTIGGRIVIVTFHSLEDRIAKEYFANHSAKKVAKSKYAHLSPLHSKETDDTSIYKILHKKPLVTSDAEIRRNPRSRSAKLRSAIKISEVL